MTAALIKREQVPANSQLAKSEREQADAVANPMAWDEQLVSKICDNQEESIGLARGKREVVIRCGKLLKKLQKVQKEQQKAAKSRGEEPQVWENYAKDKNVQDERFPSPVTCRRYMLVSTYPGAYEPDMSLDQAYRMAGKWKKNQGKPPGKTVAVSNRFLAQLLKKLGSAELKLERCNEKDWSEIAAKEQWTDDEIEGANEALFLTAQEIRVAIAKLQTVQKADA